MHPAEYECAAHRADYIGSEVPDIVAAAVRRVSLVMLINRPHECGGEDGEHEDFAPVRLARIQAEEESGEQPGSSEEVAEVLTVEREGEE